MILSWTPNLNAEKRISVNILEPGFSKHFEPLSSNLNELQLALNRWVLGIYGYYMIKDSHGDEGYWMGLTTGVRIDKKSDLFFVSTLIVEGMKKRDYHSGGFSFFALPILSAGYKFIGFNLEYIQIITDISKPILIFQIKLRILKYRYFFLRERALK
jgi:hypothetical protein